MPRIVTQTITDLVEITDLDDGISLLTFAWESLQDSNPFHNSPDAFYARTSDVTDILAHTGDRTPVTALAESAERWQVLARDIDVDVLHTHVFEIVNESSWRTRGGLSPVLLDAEAVGTQVKPEDLYRYDFHNGTMYSFVTDKPVTRPIVIEVSARDFDLAKVADITKAAPNVLGAYYDRGRPGAYDHVPESLELVVLLDQDVYERLLSASDTTYGTYTLSNLLCGIGSTDLNDVLGIQEARLTVRYSEPEDDWAGPLYPRLDDALPSRSDLWH
jgi:hypothetical protein